MRLAGWFFLVPCLFSCGPGAVLYTDDVFAAAAPEIQRAWESLAPFRNVRTHPLPEGAGLAEISAALKADPPSTAMIGLALAPADRRALMTGFPHVRLVFFQTGVGDSQIVVNRLEAWKLVARAAGPTSAAAVLFPADTSESERAEFLAVLKSQGDSAVTSWVWPELGNLAGAKTIFQWVGAPADSRFLALGPGPVVHGLPGTVRAPGARGLTWKIRESGLGDFLWNTVQPGTKGSHFLPLETVPTDHE